MESIDENKMKEAMKNANFIAWLMYTPNEKIPQGTMYNPDYSHIGSKILELIDSNVISIKGMDTDGILDIKIN
tara:strand:+ start:420 stop:638 length:219 start_codon:yes stop_codon:yes gene_type:complete